MRKRPGKRQRQKINAKRLREQRLKEQNPLMASINNESDSRNVTQHRITQTKNHNVDYSVDSLIEANMREFELFSTKTPSKIICESPSRNNTPTPAGLHQNTEQQLNCEPDDSIEIDFSTSTISPQTSPISLSRNGVSTLSSEQRSHQVESTVEETISPLMSLNSTLPTPRPRFNFYKNATKSKFDCFQCMSPPCAYLPINDPRICWHCGYLGHQRRECQNSKLYYCRLCGRLGYETQFCPCSRF